MSLVLALRSLVLIFAVTLFLIVYVIFKDGDIKESEVAIYTLGVIVGALMPVVLRKRSKTMLDAVNCTMEHCVEQCNEVGNKNGTINAIYFLSVISALTVACSKGFRKQNIDGAHIKELTALTTSKFNPIFDSLETEEERQDFKDAVYCIVGISMGKKENA